MSQTPHPSRGPARGTLGNTAPAYAKWKGPLLFAYVDPHHGCGGGEEAIRHRASEIMPYFQLRKKPLNIKLAIQSRRGREGGIWMEREGERERRTSMSLRQRGRPTEYRNSRIMTVCMSLVLGNIVIYSTLTRKRNQKCCIVICVTELDIKAWDRSRVWWIIFRGGEGGGGGKLSECV